ncbi:prephenate dehydrogenase/arogenate dehydrogenase family protein [bacterium]|nr:prephenate dehydrogenase/arogenate dehydrogenase family protein [bacterium]
MAKLAEMHVGIVGTGQLGTSLGMALADSDIVARRIAYDANEQALTQAMILGVAHEAAKTPQQLIEASNLIVLCCPLGATQDWFKLVEAYAKEPVLVTDIGSSKMALVQAAAKLMPSHRYVPGHPIAGDDRTGPQHANAQFFRNRKTYLTPTDMHVASVNTVVQLWQELGAKVETLDPVRHDMIFASSSHLPHLLAFAYLALLVESRTPPGKDVDSIFRQFMRLNGAGAATWADVFHFNHVALQDAWLRFKRSWQQDISPVLEGGDASRIPAIHHWRMEARRMLRPVQWLPTHLHDPYLPPIYRALPVAIAYSLVDGTMRAEDILNESLYAHVGEGFMSFSTPSVTPVQDVLELMVNTPIRALMDRYMVIAEEMLDTAESLEAIHKRLAELAVARQNLVSTIHYKD